MPKRMIPLSSRKRGRWSYLFFRGKIRNQRGKVKYFAIYFPAKAKFFSNRKSVRFSPSTPVWVRTRQSSSAWGYARNIHLPSRRCGAWQESPCPILRKGICSCARTSVRTVRDDRATSPHRHPARWRRSL